MYQTSTSTSTQQMIDLPKFGQKLKTLRQRRGWSQQTLVQHLNDVYTQHHPGSLSVEPQLISKWETAYSYKGRQWIPPRPYVLYLIEVLAQELTIEEAKEWAALAGHKITTSELSDIFPPELDWPPLQMPQLPSYYIERQDLEVAITEKIKGVHGQSLVLWGPGGTGKTTLAARLADLLVDSFPDGVIWVDVQANDSVWTIQNTIAESLGCNLREEPLAIRARKLHSRLRKKRCLLILDDLWAMPDINTLQLGSPTSRMLCTTRDNKVIDSLDASAITIGGLSEQEGLALLTRWAGYTVKNGELVKRLGGLALAVKLMAGQLRTGVPVEDILNELQTKQIDLDIFDLDTPQHRTESLRLCFDLSYQRLSKMVQQRFAELGYFVTNTIQIDAIVAVWGLSLQDAGNILKQLQRFALIERYGQVYQLHPLLHTYAQQKLVNFPDNINGYRQRHAVWYMSHALYHPGITNDSHSAPDLDQTWEDIVVGIQWAVQYNPQLATQGLLLGFTERAALLEAVGSDIILAVEAYLSTIDEPIEKVVLTELLGELNLLQKSFQEGASYFEKAYHLWQMIEDGLASSQAMLRVAGAYLLKQDVETAAEKACQAQATLAQSLPISVTDQAQAERLFYWFNMVYNPLIRWRALPEEDLVNLVQIANQTQSSSLMARSLHIHRLWCTTRAVSRSKAVRQKGRQLAVQTYSLWRASQRLDRADDEISLTKYLLTNYYSQRTAKRYAQRRAKATPQAIPKKVVSGQFNEGIHWWLEADEAQRVSWLSWMLPRYLAATNRPYHTKTKHQLPPLKPNRLAYHWVENILGLSTLGIENRRPSLENQPPPDHILTDSEWRILSGQRPFPLIEDRTQALVSSYLHQINSELID